VRNQIRRKRTKNPSCNPKFNESHKELMEHDVWTEKFEMLLLKSETRRRYFLLIRCKKSNNGFDKSRSIKV